MIEKSYPSKRIVETYSYKQPAWNSARDVALAKARGISVEEFVRRDNIVKELAKAVEVELYGHGFPKNKKEYDSVGEVIVTGICKTYADFSRSEEWKDDNPMIVSFYPVKNKNKSYFCTANYLTKENLHLVIEAC
jgi:hypothetical protein